jgi:hypothetical protein
LSDDTRCRAPCVADRVVGIADLRFAIHTRTAGSPSRDEQRAEDRGPDGRYGNGSPSGIAVDPSAFGPVSPRVRLRQTAAEQVVEQFIPPPLWQTGPDDRTVYVRVMGVRLLGER